MEIPLNEAAWHAESANNSSISIEICESGNREKTLKNAIELTAYLLNSYRMTTSDLRTHNDWTGKDCPGIFFKITATHTWTWFVKEVVEKCK